MRTLDVTIVQTAHILKALGHPARIEILSLISSSKMRRLSVKEIQQHLGMTQPETSKHLVLLKNLSVLFCDRKEGHSYYRINDALVFIPGIIVHLKKN